MMGFATQFDNSLGNLQIYALFCNDRIKLKSNKVNVKHDLQVIKYPVVISQSEFNALSVFSGSSTPASSTRKRRVVTCVQCGGNHYKKTKCRTE